VGQLTPEEWAEKMLEDLARIEHRGKNKNGGWLAARINAREAIAAEIREAVLEDRQARAADDIYRLARAGAYEDAAKILDDEASRYRSYTHDLSMRTAIAEMERLATLIRARAKEVTR
jgi:hypothetical protein